MHRRRWCLAPLWLATLAGLSALACGLPLRSEPEPWKTAQNQSEFKPLDFRMGYTSATGSLMDLDANEFVAETARLTSGAVTGKLLRNGAQASQQELVERLQLGELEVAVSSSALMGAAPEFGVFELPYAFQNREEVKRAVDGPLGQELAAQADKHNLVVIGYWENGFRHITNNVRPIRTPADVRGMRLRTPPDPARVELLHMWGAKPSPLDLMLLFDALKAGTFDGQENPVANIVSLRLYDVQRYISMTGHIYSPSYVIAGRHWWDALDPRLQAVLLDVARTTGDNSRERGEEFDRDAVSELAALGMQVNVDVEKSTFQRASASAYDNYKRRFGAHPLQLLEAATGRKVTSLTAGGSGQLP